MDERRYTEDEVARIFERATEAQTEPQQTARRQLRSGEGMTLAALQEIGREVGIPAELVAQAARSLEAAGQPMRRSFFGFPIAVGRTIDLERRLTEEEWEHLVVDLRDTFDARGAVRIDGSFRQWTNGNLQALVEPTPTGQRVRLRTMKASARGLMMGGLALLGGAAATFIASIAGGGLADPGTVSSIGFMSVIGLGIFGAGALQLPGWARLRLRQMEGVAARLALSTRLHLPEPPAEEA